MALECSRDIQGFMNEIACRFDLAWPIVAGEMNYIAPAKDNRSSWSYMPTNRIDRLSEHDDPYTCFNLRVRTSIGRIMARLYPELTPDKLSTISALWLSMQDNDDIRIDIVRGEDIRYWYNSEHYTDTCSNSELHHSCMSALRCQNYFDVYVMNPDRIGLAIVTHDDRLMARCLIWLLDSGKYGYDRIYAVSPEYKNRIRCFCEDKDMVDVYNSSFRSLSVSITHWDYEKYPYMDTMLYLHPRGNFALLSNSTCVDDYDDKPYYGLQRTDGQYEAFNEYVCEQCGCMIDPDEYISVGDEIACGDCAVYADYEGEYIWQNESYYLEYCDEYAHRDNCVIDANGDYLHNRHAVELYDGEYTHKHDPDLVELYNGDLALTSDEDVIALYNDEYALLSDTVELYNGQYALRNDEDVIECMGELYALHDDEDIIMICNRPYIKGYYCHCTVFGEWLDAVMVVTDHRGDKQCVSECYMVQGRYFHWLDTPIVTTYNGLTVPLHDAVLLPDKTYASRHDPIQSVADYITLYH